MVKLKYWKPKIISKYNVKSELEFEEIYKNLNNA
jgi:hypothetical protein